MRSAIALVLLAACGDGIGAPDATLGPDAALGLVKVRYLGEGALALNAVFFLNADSSLVLATRTSLDGTANAYMADGGSVTIVIPRGGTQFMYTWLAVKSGDDLVVDERGSLITNELADFSIKIPADPAVEGFKLNSSCGAQDLTGADRFAVPALLSQCDGAADMLVYTLRSGSVESYLYRRDVPITRGGGVVFDEAYRPIDSATIRVTGVPPAVQAIFAGQALMGRSRELYGVQTASVPKGVGAQDGTIVPDNGTGTFTHAMPLPPTGTLETTLDPEFDNVLCQQHVVVWGPPSAVTQIAYDARPLRRFHERPTYLRDQNAIRWSEEPEGSSGDAVRTRMAWFRFDPNFNGQFDWQIVGPRGTEPILRLPVLPSPQLQPGSEFSSVQPFELETIQADGGYDRIRPRIHGPWNLRPWPADGASGRLDFMELTPNSVPIE